MSLQHEMERLGRILAYDRDLRVDVRGTRAYSVPGRVVIPNAETYAHLGPNAERMLHGLLDHECGHARYTDHSYMERARKKGGESLASLFNSLEDGRVERLMGEEYIGCKQNLHRKNRWFWEDATWQQNFVNADAWAAFCTAATLYVRKSVTLPEIEAVRPEVADLLRAANHHGLDSLDSLTTTAAVYKLSVALWERFCEPPPPPSPPPPSPEDDESDEDESDGEEVPPGDEDAASGPGGDEPDEDEGEDEKGSSGPQEGSDDDSEADEPEDGGEGASEPAEGEDEGDDGDTEGADGGDAGPHDDRDDEATADDDGGTVDPYRAIRELRLREWTKGSDVVDPEEAISRLMERTYEGRGIYRVFSHEFDIVRDFHEQPSHEALAENFDDSPEEIERDARIASVALTQAFEVALKARRERRPVSGNDEGEVDLDLLAEFSVGSAPVDTIFRQWVAEDDRDVTVAIMLDCSGSMGSDRRGARSRDYLARRVAYALHLALSTCSIEHEITGFTTVSSEDHTHHAWTADVKGLEEHFARMREALREAHAHGVDPDLFARELWRWEKGARIAPRGLTHRYVSASTAEEALREWPLLVPVHSIFKPYGVSDARGLMYAHGIHENLDGEAVLWQARRLALRPEKRRVMFVLSDGMPSGARDAYVGTQFLKECVQRVIAAGIEVYGIGIETDAVKHFYPRHWIANSVEHLMEVAFESFASVITEGRTEVECVSL